jgi:hypothetical protein
VIFVRQSPCFHQNLAIHCSRSRPKSKSRPPKIDVEFLAIRSYVDSMFLFQCGKAANPNSYTRT